MLRLTTVAISKMDNFVNSWLREKSITRGVENVNVPVAYQRYNLPV